MKCGGNVSFLYSTYFRQERARLLLYFSVILTLHEYLHFLLQTFIRQKLLAHDSSFDGCACDNKYKENVKREFGQQNAAKEKLSVIYRPTFNEAKK